MDWGWTWCFNWDQGFILLSIWFHLPRAQVPYKLKSIGMCCLPADSHFCLYWVLALPFALVSPAKVWDNDTVRREYTLELDLISTNIDFKPLSAIQYRNAGFFQLNIILWLCETSPLYYGFQDYYLICSTLQLTLCLSFKFISFSVSLFHFSFVLKSNQTNKQEEKNERRPNKKNIHGPIESLLRTNFEMPWLSLIYLSSDSCKKDYLQLLLLINKINFN